MSGYEIATVSMLSCLVFERLFFNFLPPDREDQAIKERFCFDENMTRVKNIEQKVVKIEQVLTAPRTLQMQQIS